MEDNKKLVDLSLEELINRSKSFTESFKKGTYGINYKLYTGDGNYSFPNDLKDMFSYKIENLISEVSVAGEKEKPYLHGKLAGVYEAAHHFYSLNFLPGGKGMFLSDKEFDYTKKEVKE